MSDAYDSELRKLAHTIVEELGFNSFIREGVYAMICGPSFETPAEIRFLQAGGCDAVGKRPKLCRFVFGENYNDAKSVNPYKC